MPRLLLALALPLAVLSSACSSSSSGSGGADAGSIKDSGGSCAPIESGCGQPCDPGNSLGVGKYCASITECSQTAQAHICSILGGGSPPTYFCTMLCAPADAGTEGGLPTDCGSGASCACDNSGSCGCTPTSCLGP